MLWLYPHSTKRLSKKRQLKKIVIWPEHFIYLYQTISLIQLLFPSTTICWVTHNTDSADLLSLAFSKSTRISTKIPSSWEIPTRNQMISSCTPKFHFSKKEFLFLFSHMDSKHRNRKLNIQDCAQSSLTVWNQKMIMINLDCQKTIDFLFFLKQWNIPSAKSFIKTVQQLWLNCSHY